MAVVLVVDDSDTDRMLASKVVMDEGHHVLAARSGAEAIEMLTKQGVHMVLLDVVMPQMDGFKTCRSIRKDLGLAETPIVMVTTKNTPTDEFWAKKQGATAHLGKPYKPDDLRSILRTYIG